LEHRPEGPLRRALIRSPSHASSSRRGRAAANQISDGVSLTDYAIMTVVAAIALSATVIAFSATRPSLGNARCDT
jgi:hypothetical protein